MIAVGSLSILGFATIATFRKTGTIMDRDLLELAIFCLGLLLWAILQWKAGMALLSFIDNRNRDYLGRKVTGLKEN